MSHFKRTCYSMNLEETFGIVVYFSKNLTYRSLFEFLSLGYYWSKRRNTWKRLFNI